MYLLHYDGCLVVTFLSHCCRQSYDVEVSLILGGSGKISRAMCDLKNPYFRYTMVPPQPPPGTRSAAVIVCSYLYLLSNIFYQFTKSFGEVCNFVLFYSSPGTNYSNPTEQYWSQGTSTDQPSNSQGHQAQQQQQHPALMLAAHNSYNLPQMMVNGASLLPTPSPPHAAKQQHQALPIQLHNSIPQTAIHSSPVANPQVMTGRLDSHHFFHPQPQVTYATPIIY